jgi:hypothetical protein
MQSQAETGKSIRGKGPGSAVAPPLFRDWPRVQNDLRIDSTSIRLKTDQELLEKANEMYHAAKRELPTLVMDDRSRLAILAKALGNESEFKTVLDAREKLVKALGRGMPLHPVNAIANFLSTGHPGYAEGFLSQYMEYITATKWEAGVLAWLLDKDDIFKEVDDKLPSSGLGLNMSPEVLGIFALLRGERELAEIKLAEALNSFRNLDRWAIMKVERSMNTAIFMAMMAGVNMKELIPPFGMQ